MWDKLTYAGNLESLTEVSDSARYVFEHADICDKSAMDRIFAEHKPDAVMHLAAESHVNRSITGPAAFIETNIVGTYVLLEAARAYWSTLDDVAKKAFRFHHISTDEVYGDLPHPDEHPVFSICRSLPKPQLMRQQPVFCFKASAIIWFAPGCVPMGSQPSSLTAPITTARIISRETDPAGHPECARWQTTANLWQR